MQFPADELLEGIKYSKDYNISNHKCMANGTYSWDDCVGRDVAGDSHSNLNDQYFVKQEK